MPKFERYIGIDYSGAETADSSCKGIRVFAAEHNKQPAQVHPRPGPRRYWTRRGLAEWLLEELDKDVPTIVGIDHAFSFPLAYFKKYRLSGNWQDFLVDFQQHWPTDAPFTYIDFIREGAVGNSAKRMGEHTWLRLTEQWTATAKSVFLFDLQGSVAKSTFAGVPWLLYLRQRCNRQPHFWPFDGWQIPAGKSVVAEVYPSLWMRRFPRESRDTDEHAAYTAAAWMQRVDRDGSFDRFLSPILSAEEQEVASFEGWILGVI